MPERRCKMSSPALRVVDKEKDVDKTKALDAAVGQIERAFGKEVATALDQMRCESADKSPLRVVGTVQVEQWQLTATAPSAPKGARILEHDMTRKDYEAIAHILNSHDASDQMIEDFARMLRNDNPRFDDSRFWDSCTVGRNNGLEY